MEKPVYGCEKDVFERSRAVFNSYAGMDTPELPKEPGPALQVAHFRWSQNKVPKHTLPRAVEGVLGMMEELGEAQAALNQLMIATARLSHLMLNESQGRRGYGEDIERMRKLVADGLADHGVFAHHLATAMRLDYWTLVHGTAVEVMQRDWKKNPLTAAHEAPVRVTVTGLSPEDAKRILSKTPDDDPRPPAAPGLTGWQKGVEDLDRELNPDLYYGPKK